MAYRRVRDVMRELLDMRCHQTSLVDTAVSVAGTDDLLSVSEMLSMSLGANPVES